eukprot:1144061-Pelagomonas_calceolata.AAC.6
MHPSTIHIHLRVGVNTQASLTSSAPTRSHAMPNMYSLDPRNWPTTSRLRTKRGSRPAACFCKTLPTLLPVAASTVIAMASHIGDAQSSVGSVYVRVRVCVNA